MSGSASESGGARRGRLWLLAGGVVLASLAGYLGYVAFPRFDLPAGVGAGLLVLAAGAGVASFFSPCSFPLLVTLLTREGTGRGGPPTRALRVAVPLSVGAVIFVLGVGALIALGGRGLAGSVTFTSAAGRILRVAVGSLLLVLGLIQAEVLPITFHRLGDRLARPMLSVQARLRRRHPVGGLVLFGFGYLVAGFGWTGPILAGLAGQGLATGGFGAAFLAFVVAAVVLVGLLFAASLLVVGAREATVERMRASAPAVKRWGGHVLIVVGAWFIALGIWAETFAELFPV